jgi:peptidoglycan/LPS O-acetylase OafA/YrhL
MTSIANPNWLAVSAAFFIISGLGIVARAFLAGTADSSDPEQRRLAAGQRQVNTWLGTPLLGIGFFTHALSQLGSSPLNAFITIMLLALAFGLLMYACLEHTLVDLYREQSAPKQKVAKLAVIASSPSETSETLEPRRLEVANQT